jgi:hypothetical protein
MQLRFEIHSRKQLKVLKFSTFSLEILKTLETPTACNLTSISISSKEQHIAVGLDNGGICICTIVTEIVRQRIVKNLAGLGF